MSTHSTNAKAPLLAGRRRVGGNRCAHAQHLDRRARCRLVCVLLGGRHLSEGVELAAAQPARIAARPRAGAAERARFPTATTPLGEY